MLAATCVALSCAVKTTDYRQQSNTVQLQISLAYDLIEHHTILGNK